MNYVDKFITHLELKLLRPAPSSTNIGKWNNKTILKKFQIKVDKITDMYYNNYSKWNIRTFKKHWHYEADMLKWIYNQTIKILGGINYNDGN